MPETTQSTEVFTATDRAFARIRELTMQSEHAGAALRVSVKGGGCSGFQYEFLFDRVAQADDFTLTQDGASLWIDSTSLPFLSGSQLDFEVTLAGSQFVITNPNATAQCGCGKSFGV